MATAIRHLLGFHCTFKLETCSPFTAHYIHNVIINSIYYIPSIGASFSYYLKYLLTDPVGPNMEKYHGQNSCLTLSSLGPVLSADGLHGHNDRVHHRHGKWEGWKESHCPCHFLVAAKPSNFCRGELSFFFLSPFGPKRSKQSKQNMVAYVVRAINFKSDFRVDLRGCL